MALEGGWAGARLRVHLPRLASQQPQARILLGLSGLCIPGMFITYVMLKNRKVTKKAQ